MNGHYEIITKTTFLQKMPYRISIIHFFKRGDTNWQLIISSVIMNIFYFIITTQAYKFDHYTAQYGLVTVGSPQLLFPVRQ